MIFTNKDPLKIPLPFKDKGGALFPSLSQVSVEFRELEQVQTTLESDGDGVCKNFRDKFSYGYHPPYSLYVHRYSANQGYTGRRMVWRRRGTKGKNPIVGWDEVYAAIERLKEPKLLELYLDFERQRLVWCSRADEWMALLRSVHSFDDFLKTYS